jgi:hypothetical protein
VETLTISRAAVIAAILLIMASFILGTSRQMAGLIALLRYKQVKCGRLTFSSQSGPKVSRAGMACCALGSPW